MPSNGGCAGLAGATLAVLAIILAAAGLAVGLGGACVLLAGARLWWLADARGRTGDRTGGGGESQVRQCFERLLKARFPSAKNAPDMPWLTSRRGFPLEIDGYAPALGLGFEYQGPFHYRYNPLIGLDGEPVIAGLNDPWDLVEAQGREFTTLEAKLVRQNMQDYPHSRFLEYLENDALKAELMAAHGRALVVLPHTVVDAAYRGEFVLCDYVASRLAELKRPGAPLGARKAPVPALASPRVDRSAYALQQVDLAPTDANLRPLADGLRPLKGSMGLVAYRPEAARFERRRFRDTDETRPPLPMATIRGLDRVYFLHDKTKSADPEAGAFYDAARDKVMRLVAPGEWVPAEKAPQVTKLKAVD
ncbi:MAG TPA: hypothetical protein VNI01_10960 [Elusimicrobiota bacterium]|nr:hypothetical protein [Elusimicrobiota bacterium]